MVMKNPFENRKFQNTMFLLATITSIIYLTWRAVFTLPWKNDAVCIIFGILLLGSEITSALGTYELYWGKSHVSKMELKLPQIPAGWYPEVDVLIATHNEPVELLYKTINAIVHMDYPDKSKVHVFLCDDGNRPAMAELAAQFGVGYLGLANNKQAKSGNYNNALSHTHSPLVATFDADMIVRREFLMETVPYFFLPRVKERRMVPGRCDRRRRRISNTRSVLFKRRRAFIIPICFSLTSMPNRTFQTSRISSPARST